MKKVITIIAILICYKCNSQTLEFTTPITPIYAFDKIDTVRSLIAYCDTSFKKDNNIYWLEGYEVRKPNPIGWWYDLEYLDNNKFLLPKSFVVWRALPLNIEDKPKSIGL